MASITLGIDSLGIVGESHYQRQLKTVARQRGQQFAELIPEPNNPYDPSAVGVQIWVGASPLQVGHLSRSDARRYQPKVIKAWQEGHRVVLPAQLFGGTREQPAYGVWIGERHWFIR